MSEQQQSIIEWVFKGLSAVVLPVALYVLNMSTTIALQEQQIKALQEQVMEHKSELKKVQEGMVAVQLLGQELKQIKDDLQRNNQMMKEVYDHILRSGSPK
jgi:uncharacterized coiled-coil protein SlyX